MNAVDQGDVQYSIDNGIATVEFHNPLSNSLPGKVLAKLADTITELGTNDDALDIVVRIEGERAFLAGASCDDFLTVDALEGG